MVATPLAALVISVPVLAATGTGVNGSGTGQNTGTASLTVAKPAGVAVGDVMLANISYRSGSSLVVTAPTGWEPVAARTNTGTSTLTQATYYKLADATDANAATTGYTWNFPVASTIPAVGGIVSYSDVVTGADQHASIDVKSSNSNDVTANTTAAATGVSTGQADERLVALYAADTESTFSLPVGSDLTIGYQRARGGSNAANRVSVAGADVVQSAAGPSGDKSLNVSTSGRWVAQLIALRRKQSQTITFNDAPASATYGDTFNVNPTSDSGLAVTVSSAVGDGCDVVAGTTGWDVTMTSGTTDCDLTASQAGNGNYLAASNVPATVDAQKAGQTITFNDAPASATFGDSFNVNPTSDSGLAVTVSSAVGDGCDVVAGTTGWDVTMTSGTTDCDLTASQGGNANYSAATAVPDTVTAQKASQAITFNDAPASAGFGSTFNVNPTSDSGLAVTVTSAVGDGCDVAAGTTGWDVTMTSSTTSCELTASQAGNSNYNAATDVPQTVTATTGSQTITFTQPTSPRSYGTTFNVNPTASSGLPVTVSSAVGDGCDVVAGTTGWDVTMTSASVACELTASQAGNTNYDPATDVTRTVAAQKANQTITFTQPTSPRTFGTTFNVNPTSDSGLAVTVTSAVGDGCDVVAGTTGWDVTMTSGTTSCVLTASQTGNDNYNAASNVQRTVVAQKASQTITFDAPTSATFGDTFNVNPTSNSGLAVALASPNNDGCDIATATTGYDVTMTSGTKDCTLTASQAGNGNYLAATNVVETVTAQKASQTITFNDAPASATYGETFNVNPTSDSGLGVALAATGGCSVVTGTTGYDVTMTSGRHDCVLSATQSGNGDYAAATPNQDSVDAVKKALTVNGAAAEDKTYDGGSAAEIDFTAASLDGAINGDTPALDSSGYSSSFNSKAAGTGKPVSVTGLGLVDPDDSDNYSLSISGLTADIAKKNVTGSFTASDKYYDGTTDATIASYSLSGEIAGDNVSLSGGTAEFADPNPGLDKPVTGSGFSLGGTDGNNYNLTSVGSTTASIVQRSVAGSPNPDDDPTPDGDNPIVDSAEALLGSPVGLLAGVDLGGVAWAFAPEDQSNTLRVGAGGRPLFAIGGCATDCTIDVGKVVVLRGRSADAGTAARRKLRLKSQHFELAAGELGVVKLKLSKRQRRAIGNARKAKLVLKMALQAGATEETAKKTYRLKLKKG